VTKATAANPAIVITANRDANNGFPSTSAPSSKFFEKAGDNFAENSAKDKGTSSDGRHEIRAMNI
jgi:hypothetical protein